MNKFQNSLKYLAACAALTVAGAACAPPPPPVTHAVPDPGPGQTVALKLEQLPAPTHTNVAYGPGARQTGDVYLPTQGGNRGVIIAVHGGGFVDGNKDEIRDWFGSAMSQTRRGFAVLSINYTLTAGNEGVFPAGVRDVSAAVRWVRTQGAALGMNADTVIVAGASAGGTLSALVGTGSNSPANSVLGTTERVDGWVSYAGIYDFASAPANVVDIGRTWMGPNRDNATWVAATSAVNHIDASDPPGFVAHGDLDNIVPISQMNSLVASAAKAGVTDRLYHDKVDTGGDDLSRGHAVPCRWHLPMCGSNAAVFDSWIDAVDAGTL